MSLFDKISIEEWHKKLNKDLKSEDLSEYNWNLDNEIAVSPFLHAPEEKVQLHTSKRAWKVGFTYNSDIDTESLQSFVEKYDIDAILFDRINDYDSCHESLPSDIHLAITEEIRNSDIANADIEEIYLNINQDKRSASGFNSLIEIDTINSDSSISNILAENLSDLHSQLEELFNIDQELKSIDSFWSTLLLSNSHFRNIAMLRSWRMLSKKLFDAWEVEAETPIWARLQAEQSTEDPYINQIDFSWQFLSAVVGQADFIIVPALEFNDEDRASARLPVNISHILREESGLQKYRDPMAGSYFMEELCDKICESSWKKFQDRV